LIHQTSERDLDRVVDVLIVEQSTALLFEKCVNALFPAAGHLLLH
jgi:hypothetical protein